MLAVQYCIIPVSTCIQSDHANAVKRTEAKLNVRDELNITLEDVAFDFKNLAFGDAARLCSLIAELWIR